MIPQYHPIILASQSPRRRELLARITPDFIVCPADVDERLSPDSTPEENVRQLAQRKARAVSAQAESSALVIAADTIVVCDGTILGKPQDEADAVRMLRETGCDAVMAGRGAQGNPWLFRQINRALDGQEEGIVSPEERIALAKRHFRMEIQLHGERQGLPEMRKHIAWYMHGLRGASRFREEINTLEGCEQVLAALDRFLEEQQDAR